MAFMVVSIVIAIGVGAYTRNLAWKSEKSLWIDAATKAPGSARPLNNLAVELAWRDNPTSKDYRHALNLLKRAKKLWAVSISQRAGYISNMASIYHRLGQNDKAIKSYKEALAVDPSFRKARFDMVSPLAAEGRWDEAEAQADRLVTDAPDNADYLDLKGFISLWRHRPTEALPYLQKAMHLKPDDGTIWLNLGLALTRENSFANGEWFLKCAVKKLNANPLSIMALIENRVRANDHQGAEKYARLLVRAYAVEDIIRIVRTSDSDFRHPPIPPGLIGPVIAGAFQQLSVKFSETAPCP